MLRVGGRLPLGERRGRRAPCSEQTPWRQTGAQEAAARAAEGLAACASSESALLPCQQHIQAERECSLQAYCCLLSSRPCSTGLQGLQSMMVRHGLAHAKLLVRLQCGKPKAVAEA